MSWCLKTVHRDIVLPRIWVAGWWWWWWQWLGGGVAAFNDFLAVKLHAIVRIVRYP